jgi:ribosomal protein L32
MIARKVTTQLLPYSIKSLEIGCRIVEFIQARFIEKIGGLIGFKQSDTYFGIARTFRDFGFLNGIVLFAVPKQKVSHGRKRRRFTLKWLQNRRDIEQCDGCGAMKISNTLCWSCYNRFKREIQ